MQINIEQEASTKEPPPEFVYLDAMDEDQNTTELAKIKKIMYMLKSRILKMMWAKRKIELWS